jgi:L-threonylcarbamoyladenylate synthase
MIYKISEAVEILANGSLLCIGTDTLFALSCDATNQSAIDHLYKVKMRDREKKLPVFFYSLDHIMEYCEIPEIALNLAKKFWPGKLTIVLNLKSTRLNMLGDTIAVRIPGCDEILEIIKRLNRPIIGTSANISGSKNLENLTEVESVFSGTDVAIFNNHRVISGMQSTIISITGDVVHIIREGAISSEEIFASLD